MRVRALPASTSAESSLWDDGPPIDQMTHSASLEDSGAEVQLRLSNKQIVMKPIKPAPELKTLLERLPESNRQLLKDLLGGDFRTVTPWTPPAIDVRK